jgi:peptide/nickel transport system substrate-binding protein
MNEPNYWERLARRGTSRRRVLQGMGAASVAAIIGTSLTACGDDDNSSTKTPGGSASTSASASPAADAPKRGGEITVRRPSAMTFADPHRSSSGYDPTINHLYAAPLLSMVDGKLGPGLATKWEQVDDATSRLTLRPDLTFTDGTPVNAAAVKFAFERQADPKTGAPRRDLLKGITVETPDEHTALLKFASPNATFIESLAADAPIGVGALVSPTAFQKLGADKFNEAPVSVGPFKIEKLALDAESTFVPNEAWPITAPNGDKLPYLDRVKIRVIPQTAVAVAELQSGGIDMDYVFLGENVAQIKGHKGLDIDANKGAITQRIGLLVNKAPTNIVAFRKALNYAINRDEFASVFTDGLGGPGRGALTQLTWAYDEKAPYYPYDEKKAKDFLSQAGLASGTKVNICTYTSGIYPRMGELIQAQLKKIGIDVTVDSMEVPVYTEKYRKNGDYFMGLEGAGAPQGEPYRSLESLYSSSNQPGGAPMPEADALLDQAMHEFDQEKRKAIYGQLVKLDYDNAYKVWLVEGVTLAGYNTAVHGFNWLPSGSAMDVTQAWKKA